MPFDWNNAHAEAGMAGMMSTSVRPASRYSAEVSG